MYSTFQPMHKITQSNSYQINYDNTFDSRYSNHTFYTGFSLDFKNRQPSTAEQRKPTEFQWNKLATLFSPS